MCQIQTCSRSRPRQGFGTINDRDRHHTSVHKGQFQAPKYAKCFAENCSKGNKEWDRVDNFKTHVEKIHAGIKSKDERSDPQKSAIADDLIARLVALFPVSS